MISENAHGVRMIPQVFRELVRKTYRRPQRFRGAAALRILLGIGTLLLLIGDYSNRQLLWGPDAVTVFQRASLLRVSHDPLAFEILFHVCVVIVLTFTVVGGRILSVAFAAVVLSTNNQNIAILDGGDNLVQLIALVLPFSITNAHWSPLAQRTRWRIEKQERAAASWSFGLHNAALAIVMFQAATVYVTAALWK